MTMFEAYILIFLFQLLTFIKANRYIEGEEVEDFSGSAWRACLIMSALPFVCFLVCGYFAMEKYSSENRGRNPFHFLVKKRTVNFKLPRKLKVVDEEVSDDNLVRLGIINREE